MGVTPPPGFNSAVTEYNNYVSTQQYDMEKLHWLVGILANHKSEGMSTDEAFEFAMVNVMGQMTQAKGDESSVLAGQLDVANACANAVMSITQGINYLSSPSQMPPNTTPAEVAGNIYNNVEFFLKEFQTQQPWIDGATQASVVNALNAFRGMFSPAGEFSPTTLQDAIQSWAQNPTQTWENTGKTGLELASTAASNVSSASSAFSSSSQILGSQVQNQMGVIGQIMGAMQSVLQSLVSFLTAVNASTKSAG